MSDTSPPPVNIMGQFPFNDLPAIPMLNIFSLLDQDQQFRILTVCKTWKEAQRKQFRSHKELKLVVRDSPPVNGSYIAIKGLCLNHMINIRGGGGGELDYALITGGGRKVGFSPDNSKMNENSASY